MSPVAFLANSNVQPVLRSEILRSRVSRILDRRDPRLDLIDVEAMPLVFQAACHVAILTGAGFWILRIDFVFVLAIEPLQVGGLFQMMTELAEERHGFRLDHVV